MVTPELPPAHPILSCPVLSRVLVQGQPQPHQLFPTPWLGTRRVASALDLHAWGSALGMGALTWWWRPCNRLITVNLFGSSAA